MRLDKFLQVSRLVRRRVLANQLCDGGHVLQGGRPLRASAEVRPGAELELELGYRHLYIRILAVPAGPVPRGDAGALYELLREIRTVPVEPGEA